MSELKPTRREVYAFIALTDAVPPQEITFRKHGFSMSFDTHAQLAAWNAILGGDQITDEPSPGRDGKTTLRSHTLVWRGHHVLLWPAEPVGVPDASLGEPTASVLRELVRGPRAGDVPGEVYERDDPEEDGLPLPSTVEGYAVGGRSR